MLTLYHDIPSAASLVAVLRLQRLAAEGFDVRFRGFDVLGIELGLPATVQDIEEWERHRGAAAALGWELPRPRWHPPTLLTHLLADLADEAGRGAAWRERTYRAHWIEQVDLGVPEVLADLAGEVGLDPAETATLLDDPQQRHRLRQRMLVHRGDGIGGAPVLDANGTFMSPFVDEDALRLLAAL